jgi:hypothetical protein
MAQRIRSVALALLPAISACSFLQPVLGPTQNSGTIYAATRLTASADDAPIDLPDLICSVANESNGAALAASSQECIASINELKKEDTKEKEKLFTFKNPFSDTRSSPPTPKYEYDKAVNISIKHFQSVVPESDQPKRRSEIQEALLAKSNYLCSGYKADIMRVQTSNNLITGDLTTALAGLATIFTQVGTVRPLAGAATITSGLRSEFNSDVFANLNIQVITAGIEKRRTEWYGALVKARSCTMEQYPLQQAIKDAYIFHNYCNLYSGLEEANLSINQAQNPGLDELTDSYQKLNKLLVAVNQAYKQTKLQTASGFQISSADLSATQNFSITPNISGTEQCQIPIPGAPKTSQAAAASTMTIDTATGPIVLPFTAIPSTLTTIAAAQSRTTSLRIDIVTKIEGLELKPKKPTVRVSSSDLNKALQVHIDDLTTVEKNDGLSALDGAVYSALSLLIINGKASDVPMLEAAVFAAKLSVDAKNQKIAGILKEFDNDPKYIEAQADFAAATANAS